jgi:hypothetical protein
MVTIKMSKITLSKIRDKIFTDFNEIYGKRDEYISTIKKIFKYLTDNLGINLKAVIILIILRLRLLNEEISKLNFSNNEKFNRIKEDLSKKKDDSSEQKDDTSTSDKIMIQVPVKKNDDTSTSEQKDDTSTSEQKDDSIASE